MSYWQRAIVQELETEPGLTFDELATRLDVGADTIEATLTELIADRTVQYHGRKGGYFLLGHPAVAD